LKTITVERARREMDSLFPVGAVWLYRYYVEGLDHPCPMRMHRNTVRI